MQWTLLLLLLMGQCFFVMCGNSNCNGNMVLIKKEKTWEEALDHCRENYYDLVSITDKAQLECVEKKVSEAKSDAAAGTDITDFIWLGLRYTCTLDIWFWVNGEVLDYHIWDSPLSPNCNSAAAMKKEGDKYKWFKKMDDQKFYFICVKKGSTNPVV